MSWELSGGEADAFLYPGKRPSGVRLCYLIIGRIATQASLGRRGARQLSKVGGDGLSRCIHSFIECSRWMHCRRIKDVVFVAFRAADEHMSRAV